MPEQAIRVHSTSDADVFPYLYESVTIHIGGSKGQPGGLALFVCVAGLSPPPESVEGLCCLLGLRRIRMQVMIPIDMNTPWVIVGLLVTTIPQTRKLRNPSHPLPYPRASRR